MTGPIQALRRRRLARQAFPEAWEPILRRLPFYRRLPPEQQARLRELLKVFANEKHFFGAGGLAMTDEIRVVISAAAVRLVLRLDLSYYDRLTEIVVYPYVFQNPGGEGEARLGEAHRFGTVVLSWPAVVEGIRYGCDGRDTALHEFAHVLDRATGRFDGTPPLRAHDHYRAWAEVMSEHFLRLREGAAPERTVLRGYGAKNEAEFFAVATEVFYELPARLRAVMPDLYGELARFYGVDPADGSPC